MSRAEMIGSCKTYEIHIKRYRSALGIRGPRPHIGPREYHDRLVLRLASTPKKKIRWEYLEGD